MAYENVRRMPELDPDKDYTIEELSEYVRKALSGFEVRESLALSMEKNKEYANEAIFSAREAIDITNQLIDGTFDDAVLASNIEEKLNQKEQEYAPRLNNLEDKVNDFQNSLDEMEKDTNLKLDATAKEKETSKKMPSEFLAKVKNKMTPPTGFSWTDAPITIHQSGEGVVSTNFDASVYKYSGDGKTYYVDINNGSELNDGLTPGTALKRIHSARIKNDVETIVIASGYYDDENGLNNWVLDNKNLNLIASEGADVTISTRRFLNWTKTGNRTNVYQANRSLVANVYDSAIVDNNGDFSRMIELESIEDVDNKEGSYFYENNILYVHPFNSRAADNDICVFLDVKNLYNVGDYVTYAENIKFHGGNSGTVHIGINGYQEKSALFVAKNCEFKYSNNGSGGLTILGADAYLQNCIGARNYADGFNYHHYQGVVNKVIEVNCEGRHNGIGRGVWQDNGSTMHDGGKIIRVNGNYHHNEGPNVHDVSEGTESWNVGCQAHNSVAEAPTRVAGFQIETGEMWLDTCIAYESDIGFRVPSGILYTRNCLFEGEESIINTGEKKDY